MTLKPSDKLRKLFLKTLTVAALGGALHCDNSPAVASVQKSAGKDNIVKAFKEHRASSFSDFLKITDDFTYDTLRVNKDNAHSRLCLGRYLPNKDKIEIKRFITDYQGANAKDSAMIKWFEKFNMERYVNGVKVHELCHLSFHRRGQIKNMPYTSRYDADAEPAPIPFQPQHMHGSIVNVGVLSLTDMAQIGQYNEIGAEVGRRIYERERYLQSKDIHEFCISDKYVKAVKSGEINPFDASPDARQKEYSLLVNAVFDRWVAMDKAGYARSCLMDVEYYVEKAEKHNLLLPQDSNQKEMAKRKSACFTFPIDGKLVDFSAYIKNKEALPQPLVKKAIYQYETTHRLYKPADFTQISAMPLWQKQSAR